MGKAAELREAAIAKFKEADALVNGDDGPKAEDKDRFDTLFAEGQELTKQYKTESAREGNVLQLRDVLADVAGGVKGGPPIPFSVHSVDVSGRGRKTMGQVFVESEAYKELVASGALSSDKQNFKSRQVDVKASTDVITTIPDTGNGSPLVTPFYVPGAQIIPPQPLNVRALFSQATVQSDVISYARQTALEGAAAPHEQQTGVSGATKAQASMTFERVTSPVETIAVWMAATRQALGDAGQLQGLIDNQLTYLLKLEEEDQLLNGDGTSPNLSGIYDQGTLQTLDLTGEDNLDGIRTARRLVKTGLSKLNPDAVVMHPVDSEEFDLLKTTTGEYRGGNPIGNFTYDQPIWGLRRVESLAIAEGHALVGAFNPGGTVYERQGIQIMTADQHADFFVRNLVVVLAEERLGFAVFFPTAFVDVTLAEWLS
jgi:HK97 family phage major capsid protein